jgi:hypothetical protein
VPKAMADAFRQGNIFTNREPGAAQGA